MTASTASAVKIPVLVKTPVCVALILLFTYTLVLASVHKFALSSPSVEELFVTLPKHQCEVTIWSLISIPDIFPVLGAQ